MTVTLALGVLRHGQAQGHREEASFGRSPWFRVCDLLQKNRHAHHSHAPFRQAEMIDSGTVTRNEQTVTELHTVDELVVVNPAAPALPAHVSPAPHNTTKSELYATTRALSEPEV
jgi:hypothetical protein